MKIDDVIKELRRIRKKHGNIQVTTTGSFLKDGFSLANLNYIRQHGVESKNSTPDVFETTVENFQVNTEHKTHGKAVRLLL